MEEKNPDRAHRIVLVMSPLLVLQQEYRTLIGVIERGTGTDDSCCTRTVA
jgi:hypothetical protein